MFEKCWFQRDALGAGETRLFTCQSVTEGRFVTVHFPSEKTTPLTVCEVEVFADTGNKHVFNSPIKWESLGTLPFC